MRPAAVAVVLLAAAASAQGRQERCALCPSQVAVEYGASAHALEELTCTSCHGGDPATTQVEAAHRGDFRGSVDRRRIPEFCGSCHADPVRMQPYGLPADQLALYRISGHGRRLAAGDDSAAVCTDCHGVHAILRSDAADSPTHPRHLAATCGRCHGGAGGEVAAVADYEASVHADALRSANPRAPSCVSCHGSHGAAPPGVGAVDRVCGQCHAQAREAFRLGPHSQGMVEAGEPQCAACHGEHRVRRATHDLWGELCADCHAEGSPAVRTRDRMLTLLRQSGDELERARQSVAAARGVPLDVRDYEARLDLALTYLEEARPRSHSLDPEAVEELTRKARSLAQEVQADVGGQLRVREDRKLVVLFVWLYVLVTAAALQLYRRSFP